ncbi:MAG TPA: DUF433 domain-containing protein [Saprospiraceae bacterium]|jgi:uncharacterized protein (DUF433 family)|nr:DUF433 domain-containing protein [Saprospiraceae bacterium]
MEMTFPDFPRISVNPERCAGKPCIKGSRIPVDSVLAYLAGGMSVDDFLTEFHWIAKEDVLEALAFASLMMSGRYIPLQKAS